MNTYPQRSSLRPRAVGPGLRYVCAARARLRKLQAVLVSVAAVSVVWVAFVFKLLSFGTDY